MTDLHFPDAVTRDQAEAAVKALGIDPKKLKGIREVRIGMDVVEVDVIVKDSKGHTVIVGDGENYRYAAHTLVIPIARKATR